MERVFEKPYMKIVCFDTENVVTTSSVDVNQNVIDAQNYLYGSTSEVGVTAGNTTQKSVSALGFSN